MATDGGGSIPGAGAGPGFGGGGGPRGPLRFEDYYTAIRSTCFVFCLFGLVGNTLCFLGATRMSENGQNSSGTMFMKCLAVADNLAVVRILLNTCVPLFYTNIRRTTNFVCKTISYYSTATMIICEYCNYKKKSDLFCFCPPPPPP